MADKCVVTQGWQEPHPMVAPGPLVPDSLVQRQGDAVEQDHLEYQESTAQLALEQRRSPCPWVVFSSKGHSSASSVVG